MIDLGAHYAESARRFLQTAIVIDDQAMMGTAEALVPVRVAAPTGSLFAEEPVPEPQAAIEIAIEEQAVPSSARLNARVLSQAFLDQSMICGLYRPDGGEDRVTRASGAAAAADIVVVDWHLETGNSRPAKDIILSILQSDLEAKGRLRLIAVYTSQPGREAIAVELLAELEQDEALKGCFTRDVADIGNATTRIVVLNKRTTPEAADRDEVVEERLPGRLISEFAKLTEGVVPSFALASATAIRGGVHHVLSQYTADLDGAFTGHLCGLPHPDDAKSFALDLITSELRNLIELEDVPGRTLKAEVIEAWIEAKIAKGDLFQTDKANVPAAQVKAFVKGGANAIKDSAEHQTSIVDPRNKAAKKDRVTSATVSRIFYSSTDAARTAVHQLARLSTFQREPHRTRPPEHWLPKLTLGTVVQEVTENADGRILICVQPRCDSVRLEAATAFPFQTAGAGEQFNLVLRDMNGADRQISVNLKPRDAVMIEFEPHAERRSVLANRRAETSHFVFEDLNGNNYAWLGDIMAMKAQRWVSELGSRVQVVGMDELEWLRQAGEGKVAADWQ